MATQGRVADPSITAGNAPGAEVHKLLGEAPGSFDFFQAVRLILRLLGGDAEALHFESRKALSFPPSQIDAFEWTDDRARMVVAFLGLIGPSGVLPRSYSDLVLERLRNRDTSLAAFLDIFNDRMIRLFYEAWEKYQFAVKFERDGQDRLTRYLMAFIGLATPGLQRRLGIDDRSLLLYSGLLGLQARSATALEQIVQGYFGVPAEVEQFVGAWQELPESDLSIMDEGSEYCEQLGVGAVVGDAIWDQQSRIRVRLGPLKQHEYLEFLPTGNAYPALGEIVKFFCGIDIEVELQLVLERDDVPRCDLDEQSEAGPRLGWFTWMKSAESFDRCPSDTLLLLA